MLIVVEDATIYPDLEPWLVSDGVVFLVEDSAGVRTIVERSKLIVPSEPFLDLLDILVVLPLLGL